MLRPMSLVSQGVLDGQWGRDYHIRGMELSFADREEHGALHSVAFEKPKLLRLDMVRVRARVGVRVRVRVRVRIKAGETFRSLSPSTVGTLGGVAV